MHTRVLVPCLLAVLLAAGARSLNAQDDEKLHGELRNLNQMYETAINSGDLSPMASLFTPETSGVVVENQEFKSLAELQDIYARFHATFPNTVYHISMDPDRSQIFGNIAVAHGKCDESVKMPVGSFEYTSTWTAVLKRDNGKWTLIRSQVTMDPFGSSIVKFLIRKARLTFGLGGIAVGILLGISFIRVLSRRPGAPA